MLVRTHVDAVIARLESETGRSCGNAQAPETATPPFMVLYPLPSAERDGSLKNYDELQTWTFQITSVGATAEQCMWMADEARQALIGVDTITVTGRAIQRVESDTIGGSPIRDPQPETQLFSMPESFRMFTYPT